MKRAVGPALGQGHIMRARALVVVIVAALVIAAALVTAYAFLPSQTQKQTSVTQTTTTVASSSSTNYPSRADLAIVGSTGNGDDAYFAPSNFTVAVNATITWTNQDRLVVHNVVSTGSTSFSSGDINPGASWSFTFTRPGTYSYFCSYHPWMIGSVTVVGQATR
jgi:plastocyanin